jgi:hypothetical protein
MYEIGNKYKTDKISTHRYHEIFPLFIEKFYGERGGMIEVGIAGGSSLQMWLELFPEMHIYGIDIGVEKSDLRCTVFKADQSCAGDLDAVIDKIKHSIHFINDDGSHVPEHQLLTFNKLFPLLETGGVYIIEDIETSYWRRGSIYGYPMSYGYKHPKSIVEIFKAVLDNVNSLFAGAHYSPVKNIDYINSITFARNCIIITKKEPQPQRRYNFQSCL